LFVFVVVQSTPRGGGVYLNPGADEEEEDLDTERHSEEEGEASKWQ